MKIEEMKRLKREWGYTNEDISEQTGVAVGTIQKIFSGETKSPRRETIEALEKLFGSEDHFVHPGPVYDFLPEGPVLVKEGNLAEQYEYISGSEYIARDLGPYTAGDYEKLRKDHRIELIDGYIYNLAAPTATHQIIVGAIITELKNFVRKKKKKCIPFAASVSVRLDQDDKTAVEPDLMILCDPAKIRREKEDIWGAPDLVMEVLSPSTRGKDTTKKLSKYCAGGVREYWVIDPKYKQIIVYSFEQDNRVKLYTFEDKVPIGIWNGECEIDFAQISAEIEQVFSWIPEE